MGHVQGLGVRVLGEDPAWLLLPVGECVDLVGKTDTDQRTAGTLRTVHQGWRWDGTGSDVTQFVDDRCRLGDQFIGERDRDPFTCRGVVELPLGAGVPGIAQEQPLHAQLNAFGIVCPMLVVRWRALLRIDRAHGLTVAFEDVEDRGQSQPGRGDRYRASLHPLVGLRAVNSTGRLVHVTVHEIAFDGVVAVGPLPADPFQVEQPMTVDELVDHPCRHSLGDSRRRVHMGLLHGGTRSSWTSGIRCRTTSATLGCIDG